MCWKGTNCSAITSFSSAVKLSGWAEFHPTYLLAGRAATSLIWSSVSHPKIKCPASLPEGWYEQVSQVLRMSCKGAKPVGTPLCCAIGGGARDSKGFLLLFPRAVPQKQDLVTLKVHLPNYSISLFSYTWERAFMFPQRSKWREGQEGWSASLSSGAMEPLMHKLRYSCREEKMWATLAETLAAHHCLQLEFLLRAFTNDNLGQE